ncbi:MAG: hypothetical protein J5725_10445 [Bacteroidales bacterium]|nr:hypothetical protein [Bacteroidales bacterium]
MSSCPQLIDCVQQLGFLPLLNSGIQGYCAEEMMAPDYRYTQYEDGSWEWPLWTWKSPVIMEGNCVYGKFFGGKAGFVSREWWPDFYNYRRSIYPQPEFGSIEETILTTLWEQGSAVARDLRAACGLTGPKMRSRFDAFVNRLQMGCYIVTEGFVYPRDKHGNEYGFGWQLLNTPEHLLGRVACIPYTDNTHTLIRTPEESYQRMIIHLQHILPNATEKQLYKLLK